MISVTKRPKKNGNAPILEIVIMSMNSTVLARKCNNIDAFMLQNRNYSTLTHLALDQSVARQFTHGKVYFEYSVLTKELH